MMRTAFLVSVLLLGLLARPALAGDLQGRITDASGGVLVGAAVRLVNIATGQTTTVATDSQGRYRFPDLPPGPYRVVASAEGFAQASRTVVLETAEAAETLDVALEIGTFEANVTVAAARGERDTRVLPIRADVLPGELVHRLTPPSTGDVLLSAPGVTPVGSGPFQIRPRLRGLDSTRVLVLVDGERLNNARTATDRAGVEVGLVAPDAISRVEVLAGAGSVLYGTDALSGTINIVTNQPLYSSTRRYSLGFDGYYSSNEHGRRGTVSLGASDERWAVSFLGGAERFDDYQAGGDFAESSVPWFEDGTLIQADTVDDAFGFQPPLHAFPDPFNAPFTRTSATVPRSGMEGSSANLAVRALVTPTQELQVKYQRRRASNIGFPDFQAPFFFQTITLPWSRFDKFSASYAITDITPWLTRLSVTGYLQQQDRLLHNEFPAQFPAPTPGAFFPIGVFRLDIESDTRQQVETPGLDVQATLLPRPDNMLTAGVSVFSDRSEDERTTETQMSMIGQVALAAGRPIPVVLSQPVPFGPALVEHPVRVPNASFRDVGLYLQDEWDVSSIVRLTGGVRLDLYRVQTDPTPGYDILSLIEGADPGIDPAALPNANGDEISRTAFTGEAGVALWSSRPVSFFAHYVRSYRHPNLEELLFSGRATVGNIVPNVKVEPETGHNVDLGVRVNTGRFIGSLSYFVNDYDGFISTEIVAESPEGDPISQAINFSEVRIHGVEAQADVPLAAGGLYWTPFAQFAATRGTLSAANPLPVESLALAFDEVPQDNITPWKLQTGLRVSDRGERWWGSYSLRSQGDVTRVSPLLEDSPFLIAQDLLALEGFTVQRLAFGYTWMTGDQRLGLTLAVDNLADTFYREHFQFAPARGRSISLAVTVRGVQ
jgi:outer membrane receptor protein involved in Fe transport